MSNETMQLNLTNKEELITAYIPYIQQGGFTIANSKNFKMGDTFKLELKLLDESQSYFCVGKVVLLNPSEISKSPYGNIGVQMTGETSSTIQKKIETYLAGVLKN